MRPTRGRWFLAIELEGLAIGGRGVAVLGQGQEGVSARLVGHGAGARGGHRLVGGGEGGDPFLGPGLGAGQGREGGGRGGRLHRLLRVGMGVLARAAEQIVVRHRGQGVGLDAGVAEGGGNGAAGRGRGRLDVARLLLDARQGQETLAGVRVVRELLHPLQGLFRLALLDLLFGLGHGLVQLLVGVRKGRGQEKRRGGGHHAQLGHRMLRPR